MNSSLVNLVKQQPDLQDIVTPLEVSFSILNEIKEKLTQMNNNLEVIDIQEKYEKLVNNFFPELINNYCNLSIEYRNTHLLESSQYRELLTSKKIFILNIEKLIEEVKYLEIKINNIYSTKLLVQNRLMKNLGSQKPLIQLEKEPNEPLKCDIKDTFDYNIFMKETSKVEELNKKTTKLKNFNAKPKEVKKYDIYEDDELDWDDEESDLEVSLAIYGKEFEKEKHKEEKEMSFCGMMLSVITVAFIIMFATYGIFKITHNKSSTEILVNGTMETVGKLQAYKNTTNQDYQEILSLKSVEQEMNANLTIEPFTLNKANDSFKIRKILSPNNCQSVVDAPPLEIEQLMVNDEIVNLKNRKTACNMNANTVEFIFK